MSGTIDTSEAHARELDAADPLARFRERFEIPPGTIYMDGNSLGLLCREAAAGIEGALDDWRQLAIRGWLDGDPPWFTWGERLGAAAAPLVGAAPDEVVATGTTTLDIHALVSSFYRPETGRTRIVALEPDFPTDIYALRGQIALRGLDPDEHLVLVSAAADGIVDEDLIAAAIDEQTSLLWVSAVLYRSGQLLDLPRLAREARARGALAGFDCSHAVGAVPHRFDEWEVDMAVWCSYKYLNGGPGSPAFLYLNRRHADRGPGLPGWFGCVKERQFDLSPRFEHERAAGGWQISSPSALGMGAVEGSLGVIREAGIEAIRRKSLRLTGYLVELADTLLAPEPCRFRVVTPREASRRGGHIALARDEEALRIKEALVGRGIVTDFRPPDIIRIAPIALYNTFEEVRRVVLALREIVETREYERVPAGRQAIT
ncbi:MAG: kynureninase [Candidatus Krumholzibacteriota bacterium]|nr:kynureninase [Candidatus Krumholzibacteriota bacterium]